MSAPLWAGQVRTAGIQDLDALTSLFEGYRAFYGARASGQEARSFLRDRLRFGQSQVFLAEEVAGPAVGFAQVYPTFTSVGLAQVLVLNDLFVNSSFRGRGVGMHLLAAVRDYARGCGAGRLRLSTGVRNEAAQRLYARAGWARVDEYIVYELQPQVAGPGEGGV